VLGAAKNLEARRGERVETDPSSPTTKPPGRPPGSPPASSGAVLPFRALIVASLILPAVLFALSAWQNRADLEAGAAAQAQRTARLFAEHALKVFESNEQLIRRIDERLAGMGWDEIRASSDLNAYLARVVGETPHVRGLGLVAPDGRIAQVSGVFPLPEIDVSDRDYVRQAAGGGEIAAISTVVEGRISGEALFRISRRTSAGPAGGVVFVSIDPRYFLDFYRSVTGGADSVTMARRDGAVLARDPPVTTGAQTLSPDSGFMRSIAQAERGVYRTTSELDRVERIHAYGPVAPYPVFVSYGLSLTGVAENWRADLLWYGLLTALSSLALVALSVVARRRAAAERRSFLRWQDEARRRETAEAALRQAQKMEAVGQLTGGVAHDFNNLLTVIIGNLDVARRRLAGGDGRALRAVENATQGATRAAALVERLLAFSRRQPIEPQAVDVEDLIRGMADLLRRSLGENVRLDLDLPRGLWPVSTDPNQLENALVNLAVNARDAMPAGGALTISARNADRPSRHVEPGEYVVISVADTGAGMPPDVLERVFEPFFTTKEVGKGTGLGLSQVYGFAKQSDGDVGIESEVGRGTTVRLILPRAASAAAQPGAQADVSPQGGRETLLIVEDDEAVRRFAAETLAEFGYEVLEAADAEAGSALLRDEPRIALLLTDVGLPGTSGRELAVKARAARPGLPVLLITGHAKDDPSEGLDAGLLRKPFSTDDLARAVRRSLDRTAEIALDGRRA